MRGGGAGVFLNFLEVLWNYVNWEREKVFFPTKKLYAQGWAPATPPPSSKPSLRGGGGKKGKVIKGTIYEIFFL